MEYNKYDIVIKSHEKDYCKLKFNINSFKYLNPQPSNIYIVSKDGYAPSGTDYDNIIKTIKDEEVVPFIDREKISYRKNWSWCNLISLFQNFTENDYYLDVQADNFFLKNIDLFEEGKPILYNTTNNPNNNWIWSPYFNFSKLIFYVDKVSIGSSYITEFILYNKNYTKMLLSEYSDFNSMMNFIYININSDSYPADQEIYGNFIESKLKDKYKIKLNTPIILMGIESKNEIDEKFIEELISTAKIQNNEALALSYHSWWDDQL
jgi:hypothetical protein